MTDGAARVRFSIAEGLIEIEGSEAFVADQLSKFEPLITKILQSGVPTKDASPPNKKNNGSGNPSGDAAGLADYENLFALADGKIQILKDLPGSGKSPKTISAALLLGFANQLQGIPSVAYETIRDLCSAHACLDGPNFAKTIRGSKEYFIVTGNGGSLSVSLTVPGKKKALELATSLKT